MSGETTADSMLLSSLSVGTALQATICYGPLCLAMLWLTICFIYDALSCVAVLHIQLDYLPFCQVRLKPLFCLVGLHLIDYLLRPSPSDETTDNLMCALRYSIWRDNIENDYLLRSTLSSGSRLQPTIWRDYS
jgi:hypothetical protein